MLPAPGETIIQERSGVEIEAACRSSRLQHYIKECHRLADKGRASCRDSSTGVGNIIRDWTVHLAIKARRLQWDSLYAGTDS